jgi:hypothetical protein
MSRFFISRIKINAAATQISTVLSLTWSHADITFISEFGMSIYTGRHPLIPSHYAQLIDWI